METLAANPLEFFLYEDAFCRILENVLNFLSMNWGQFKCSFCYLCLCGTLLTPVIQISLFTHFYYKSVEFLGAIETNVFIPKATLSLDLNRL